MPFDSSSIEINFDLMNILLVDMTNTNKTTKKNIIWATDDYNFSADSEIQPEQTNLIKPRFEKFSEQQKSRTRDKAEIFTPSWICNEQNNLIDDAWFGRKNVFNITVDNKNHIWQSTAEKIFFYEERTWQSYVEENRLEITCGEAPYLVSLYDSVTGESIPIKNRIGMLDRKLRVVSENLDYPEEWMTWALKAVQSIYGYELQGDNLFLARKNIFWSVKEYFRHKFCYNPPQDFLRNIAEVISWNLWQMDGLEKIIPYSNRQPKTEQISLLNSENACQEFSNVTESANQNNLKIYCKIKDWKTGEEKIFSNLGAKANGQV